jgi:hypothetical protein
MFLAMKEIWKDFPISDQSKSLFRYEAYEEFLSEKVLDLEGRP